MEGCLSARPRPVPEEGCLGLRPLRFQQSPSPQWPLQRGLHLHVLELGDVEVEVLLPKNAVSD